MKYEYEKVTRDVTASIGIPVFNDRGYLRSLLQTIKWYTCHPNYHVVVVDDASPDKELQAATIKLCEEFDVPLVVHPENKGVAGSWNTLCREGIKRKADVLVLLNSDIIVPPLWLTSMIFALKRNEEAGHVGSVFCEPINVPPHNADKQMALMAEQLWHSAYIFVQQNGQASSAFRDLVHMPTEIFNAQQWGCSKSMAPNGTGFAFTTKTYNLVGDFDEQMKAFHEESDFGCRCASEGMFSFGLPWPRTYHGQSRTFTENNAILEPHKLFTSSKKRFIEKWGTDDEHGNYFNLVHNTLMAKVANPVDVFALSPVEGAFDDRQDLLHGGTVHTNSLIERQFKVSD